MKLVQTFAKFVAIVFAGPASETVALAAHFGPISGCQARPVSKLRMMPVNGGGRLPKRPSANLCCNAAAFHLFQFNLHRASLLNLNTRCPVVIFATKRHTLPPAIGVT